MLAKRVILALCFNEGVLHRTKQFRADYRYTQAFSWAPDADEIVLIDVTRHEYDHSIFHNLVKRYCRDSGLPMTVGGRVRTVDEARKLFDLGADRILVGYGGRGIYEDIAKTWGSQALVAGIDIGRHEVLVGAAEAESLGAGEILLTSIDRDGSLGGYDLSTLQQTREVVGVPVIVAGGCGGWPHMREAFQAGAAGAVTTVIHHLAPSAMRTCKQYLAQNYDGTVRPAA